MCAMLSGLFIAGDNGRPPQAHKQKLVTLKAIIDGKIVGTVMEDFRKAFDLVDHDLLLQKLEIYKCSNDFLKLMRSYLSNRSQAVSLGGKMSEKGFVTCVVPQGSIIGPLLFLIFIKDLPLFLGELVFSTDLYADDTTIYDIQKDLPTVIANLQRVLDCFKEWCKKWYDTQYRKKLK